MTLYKLSWMVCGKEIILISKNTLKIKYSFCELGFYREYSLSDIDKIELSMTDRQPHNDRSLKFGIRRFGNIMFNYNSKKYLFGVEINWSEARTIINILERHQSLRHG